MGTKAGSRWVPASGQRIAADHELDGLMCIVRFVKGGDLLELVRLIKLILEGGPAARPPGPRYTPQQVGSTPTTTATTRGRGTTVHGAPMYGRGNRLDRTEDR